MTPHEVFQQTPKTSLPSSKGEFQRKLDLPGRGQHATNGGEISDRRGLPGPVKRYHGTRSTGIREIGTIQEVEKLSAKLQFQPFRYGCALDQ